MDMDIGIKSILRKWCKSRCFRYKPFVIIAVAIFAFIVVTEILSLRSSVVPEKDESRGEPKKHIRSVLEKVVQRAATRIQSRHKPILLSFVRNNTMPFVYNWICHVKDLVSYENVHFITLYDKDKEEIEEFESTVNVFSLENEFENSNVAERIQQIHILHWQVSLIFKLLKRNINVFIFRVESVWLQNPLILFEKFLSADRRLDLISATFTGNPSALDSGLYFMKSSAESIMLMAEYLARLQNILYRLNDTLNRVLSTDNALQYFSLLVYFRFGKVRYHLLSEKHSMDVPSYIRVSAQNKRSNVTVYILKNYYLEEENQTRDKISLMQEVGLWFLDEEYKCEDERVILRQPGSV